MILYNCESKEELKLKEIELEDLGDIELLDLTMDIRKKFQDSVLKDENIIVDAMTYIILELMKRVTK